MKKYIVGMMLSALLVFGFSHIAKADVCFLPEGEGCETVPYNEGIITEISMRKNQSPAQAAVMTQKIKPLERL